MQNIAQHNTTISTVTNGMEIVLNSLKCRWRRCIFKYPICFHTNITFQVFSRRMGSTKPGTTNTKALPKSLFISLQVTLRKHLLPRDDLIVQYQHSYKCMYLHTARRLQCFYIKCKAVHSRQTIGRSNISQNHSFFVYFVLCARCTIYMHTIHTFSSFFFPLWSLSTITIIYDSLIIIFVTNIFHLLDTHLMELLSIEICVQ